ncbi:MAG: phosphatidate cytidylyltransferase [Terriglobia bacterium]
MKKRVLTAVCILVPVLYLAGWSPPWLFMAALVALVEGALHEFFLIGRLAGMKPYAVMGYAAGALVCLAQWPGLENKGLLALIIVALISLVMLAVGIWESADLHGYSGSAAITVLGVLYVAFNLSCLFPLRFSGLGSALADGRQLVFLLLVVIVAGDIFAYFTGRLLGHTPMFSKVSPHKTVEGAIGGLAASLIFGSAYARWFWRTDDWKVALLLALAVAVAGQAGDLTESAFKRAASLKDSGAVLPGHGGILDRIDSMLFGAPVLWLALILRDILH